MIRINFIVEVHFIELLSSTETLFLVTWHSVVSLFIDGPIRVELRRSINWDLNFIFQIGYKTLVTKDKIVS